MFNFSDNSSGAQPEPNGPRDGRWRTENGKRFEAIVSDAFRLKKSKIHSQVRPDIFAPANGIIGEVKSVFAGEKRVVLYTEQIRKYLRLADDMKEQTQLDKEKIRMQVLYFIVSYDDKESPKKIYVLDREILGNLLGFEEIKSRWRLPKNHKLQKRMKLLDAKDQTFLSAKRDAVSEKSERSNLQDGLVSKNDTGAYVRLDFDELDALCPVSSRKRYDGKRVLVCCPPSLSAPRIGLAGESEAKNAEPLAVPLLSGGAARKKVAIF